MAINTQPLSNIANLIAQKAQADANRQERQFQTGVQIAQSGLARFDAQQQQEQAQVAAQQQAQVAAQQQAQSAAVEQQKIAIGSDEFAQKQALDEEGQANLQAFRAAQQATDLAQLDAATVEKAIDHAADIAAAAFTVPDEQFNQALATIIPELVKAFPNLEGVLREDMTKAEYSAAVAPFGVSSPKDLTPQEKGETVPSGFRLTDDGNLEPIPGGPAARLSGESTKLLTLAATGKDSLKGLSEILGSISNIDIAKAGILPNFLKSEDGKLFSLHIDNLTDIIGRFRSGGAISESEEKRFRKLLPQLGDSQKIIDVKTKTLTDMFATVEGNILGTADKKPKTSGVDISKPEIEEKAIDFSAMSVEELEAFISSEGG